MDFLEEIINYKKGIVKKKGVVFDGLAKNVKKSRLTRYGLFKQAISQPGRIHLIAEVKKASPSRGLLREDFDAVGLAQAYSAAGAAAISVLTEDKYFLGRLEYVRTVSQAVQRPVLAKDFFIDACQIYEAFQYGASAILLIAAILSREQLVQFQRISADLDMDCLVEVHNEQELDQALESGAEIIGINNRDLRSFEVDIAVSERLIPRIPSDKVIVAESGIKSQKEVLRLKGLGANAVLIGETFLREKDVAAKVHEVMGSTTHKEERYGPG